ncbi:YveK family protein [Peptostreptococcus equinus]|uniref:Wzz/FepE/Etk N-terminal domain-containing protein n=1 Tax=Peptostreptococcus equinus TaxID=3003601 RepID=A0ABY7JMU6_9FIRM|nr:Wzz/FepE/Etk N-terminal domain-containing protein [Peptostreptococcus sp. CBA3647]WAW14166.1 Wzz/FepE/Etk N-terminal domain-containing protein [Peptostreptococcus sp. CBA3647]
MEQEIDLLEIWQAIRKRIIFILLSMIIVGGLTFAVNKLIIPAKYEAKTTMIIGKPNDTSANQNNIEFNDVMVNQKLVTTYSEIIKSRSIADQVIKILDLKNFDMARYHGMISVNAIKDTEVLSVSVVDTIPARAMDMANTTAQIFQKEVKGIMNIDNVKILDEATLPKKPVSPNVLRNTIIGALIAGITASFIAVFRELNKDTYSSTQQLQNEFGISVIGVIPNVKRGEN